MGWQVQLTAPGVNSSGAVWVGFPVLRQCFDDVLGWTQTTNNPCMSDLFGYTTCICKACSPLLLGSNEYRTLLMLYINLDLLLTDRLTLDGDDGYVIDGKVKKFDTHIETIKVLQPGGMHREEQLEIRRSVHGPVVLTPQLNIFDLFYVALDP